MVQFIFERKKLGGILTESVFSGQDLGGVIVGIGLNVNQDLNEFPEELKKAAVVLRTAVNRSEQLSREIILAEILNNFEELYKKFKAGKEQEILNKWRSLSSTIGRKVTISLENDVDFIGTAVDLNELGELIVETENGKKQSIIAGDCIHLNER